MRLGDLGARSRCSTSSPARCCAHDSIVGTTFSRARSSSAADDGVVTEVEGTAFRTGEHRFVLDPRDELGTGFVLR